MWVYVVDFQLTQKLWTIVVVVGYSPTERKIELFTVRVYLKSGRSFDMQAEVVKCKHNSITGELVSLSYEGATTGIPLYLDVNQVEAVVQVTTKRNDDCDKET